MVGTLLTTDQDANDTHTYTLSGADADLFEIVEGYLKLKDNVAANYEAKNVYVITITSTDSTGLSISQSFNITVTDTNDSPTAVNLSSLRLEHDKDGYVVGTLITTDEDTNDTYTYTLSGDDADSFEVINGQLKLKEGIKADFETKNTYLVTVTSTDSSGESISQSFTLNVVKTIDITSFSFSELDIIIFGRESAGVPDYVHNQVHERLTIPMQKGLRSLNISSSVAMVIGEASRQLNLI